MTDFQLNGLIAAPFTPFDAHGSVNLDLVPALADQLKANGVAGAFVCGTTGEGPSLSTAERIRISDTWLKHQSEDLKIIIHVGHLSIAEARMLARHAEESGADAIGSIAPSFFKPGPEALVAYCQEIAAEAPSLPFYYYHMPSMTGVSVTALEFLQAAHGRIQTLTGVKFTHEDLSDYRACREFADGKYDILFGRDEILLNALALGATGAVGSTYNYLAPLFRKVMQAYANGDLETARTNQTKATEIISIMVEAGGLTAAKSMMRMIGFDCGSPRLPLQGLRDTEEQHLRHRLEDAGFFDL